MTPPHPPRPDLNDDIPLLGAGRVGPTGPPPRLTARDPRGWAEETGRAELRLSGRTEPRRPGVSVGSREGANQGRFPPGVRAPSLTFSVADVRRRSLQHPLRLRERQLRQVEQLTRSAPEEQTTAKLGHEPGSLEEPSPPPLPPPPPFLNWRMEEEEAMGVGELGCRGTAGQPFRRQEALASGRPCGSGRLRHGAAIPQYNGGSEQSRTQSDGGKRGAPWLSLSALFPLLPLRACHCLV